MTEPKIPVDLILAKLAAEAEKVQHRLEKAKDILLGPLNTDIAITPHEVVYQEDRVRLKHYRPLKEPRLKTPSGGAGHPERLPVPDVPDGYEGTKRRTLEPPFLVLGFGGGG